MDEINMVAKTFNDSIFFHAFFMYFIPIPFLFNLYVLFSQNKGYVKINLKIWFVMPIIFFLVAVAFFSGIFVMAMNNFFINFSVILMVLYTLFIFIGEIIRVKKFKLAKTKEELMKSYIKFCKTLYISNLVLYFIVLYVAGKNW